MKKTFAVIIFQFLTSFGNSNSSTSENEFAYNSFFKNYNKKKIILTNSQSTKTKLSLIVLPPYDELANAGISPDIKRYLEGEIFKDTSLILKPFSYKQLAEIPYQNVFDKKYCKPIADKIGVDIIILSKLELLHRTGKMSTDKWRVSLRIYNNKTFNQVDSKIYFENLTKSEIISTIKFRGKELIDEIKNNR